MADDDLVAKVAQAYALDAVRMAQAKFKIALDWSEESIGRVEQILDRIHKALAAKPVSDEVVSVFAKTFGSYVGEVFRKHHGGGWCMMEMNGEPYPGIKDEKRDFTFWPWGKTFNRLHNGPIDNVAVYYKVSVKGIGG
jgi:hypothetical protein